MRKVAVVLGGALLFATTLIAAYYWIPSASQPTPLPSTLAACAMPATDAAHPGMVWVPPGHFRMGGDYAYPEEGPSFPTDVGGFWMDQSEVTNAQFSEFVAATGYQSLAERGISNPDDPSAPPIAGSAVFRPPYTNEQPDPFRPWWQFQPGASWHQPSGPGSSIAGLEQHPVVHVAFEDALAYAQWKGHNLPTEAQFEYAAQGTTRETSDGQQIANTWQGLFPFQHEPTDGFADTAPVGCYTPNALGLYDMIGNVWEWTASPYYMSHDFPAKTDYPEGFDPTQSNDPVAVIKGGSFLCAPNYCMRYRPEARQGQSKGLGTEHIGFRTVFNP